MFRYLVYVLVTSLILISCSEQKTTVTSTEKVNTAKEHYRLVVDAGSSGSRIYIYHIVEGGQNELPEITFIDQRKVTPGVSKFPENEANVLLQMDTLLEFAESKIEQSYWEDTELHLIATAGMRLLPEAERYRTMEALTNYLEQEAQFNFQEAIVLSGQYEGLYGWTALNYLDDRFDPEQTRESLLEMGGASTQIAFLTEKKGESVVHRKYGETEFDLYAKSYLNMGQDRALKIAGVPACFPKGYPLENQRGIGNFNQCGEEIIPIFNEYCAAESNTDCLFNTEFQASTADEYIAISAFFYTFDFFGFKNTVELDELERRGQEFCEMSWEQVVNKYPKAKREYLSAYCFNASYFYTLFTRGYGMNNTFVIESKNDIEDKEITWTLGAALDLEMGYIPEKY